MILLSLGEFKWWIRVHILKQISAELTYIEISDRLELALFPSAFVRVPVTNDLTELMNHNYVSTVLLFLMCNLWWVEDWIAEMHLVMREKLLCVHLEGVHAKTWRCNNTVYVLQLKNTTWTRKSKNDFKIDLLILHSALSEITLLKLKIIDMNICAFLIIALLTVS